MDQVKGFCIYIECAIDIGNHIISDMRYRKPETNRDVFEILHENEIISLKLKENLGNMAFLRYPFRRVPFSTISAL